MSVNETIPARNDYTSSGATDYNFTFALYDQADLSVYQDGVLNTLNTDYRVRNGVSPFTSLGNTQLPATGFIQFINGDGTVKTLASGIVVSLLRDQPVSQLSDYTINEAFPSLRLERDYDKLVMLHQQLEEVLRRCLRSPVNEPLAMTLPNVASRKNNVLGFTTAGLPTAVPLPTAGGGDLSLSTVLSTGSSTARTLAERMAEWVNPKDYGAVGDGVAIDQTAVANAVAYAFANSLPMFWPKGTFLTNATIPNVHNVRHRGFGIIKRGTDTFAVDPSLRPGSTNILYVATTGADTNDGLSSSEPRLTILATGNVIYNYSYGDVTWKVTLSAGTYVAVSQNFFFPFPSSKRVIFAGPAVSAGVQPTAIIQATGHGAGSVVQGLYFQNYVRVQVQDINFRNYRNAASPSANSLSSGLIVDTFCDLYTINVWTDDSDQGIYVTNGSIARIEAGRHGSNNINGANVQFIRHSRGTVGYNGTLADNNGATGTALRGGTYGIMIQEFSMVHADFCYFNTQTNSGVFLTLSRVHALSSVFLSNLVGVDARLNSNISSSSNTFTTCPDDIRLLSGSRISGVAFAEGLNIGPPIKEVNAVNATTSSTTPVTFITRVFEAKELATRGAGFKLRIYGEAVNNNGTKTIVVTLGATTLLTAVIAAATTDYEIHVDLLNSVAASSQKVFTRKMENGVLPVLALNVSIAEDLTASKTLTVTHQVANAADTNRVGFSELEIQH